MVSFITLFGIIHDHVDFVKSFFVNQSILLKEYDFIIVGKSDIVIRMNLVKLLESLDLVKSGQFCNVTYT